MCVLILGLTNYKLTTISGYVLFAATPLSSSNVELTNNSTNGLTSNVISADSSVASSGVSLDGEEDDQQQQQHSTPVVLMPVQQPVKAQSKKKNNEDKKVRVQWFLLLLIVLVHQLDYIPDHNLS